MVPKKIKRVNALLGTNMELGQHKGKRDVHVFHCFGATQALKADGELRPYITSEDKRLKQKGYCKFRLVSRYLGKVHCIDTQACTSTHYRFMP